MTNMIYCYCPKCQKRVHDYIRKGTTEFRQLRCSDCGLRFKVNIKEFFKHNKEG